VNTFGHGSPRDVLGSLKVLNDELTLFGSDRSQSEPTVAHHDGRDSMPTRGRTKRVPHDLCIHVRVTIDESGGDHMTFGIEFGYPFLSNPSDGGDPVP
jgi:hypothetical protein